ncbi:MAG: LacI family DNA-binding transcriptional regulator [Bryobacteraceae bacterium]|nr:LacI family DNA-binding transcriptional regulator [Bryobacteraceae bacterium]
MKLEEVAKRAKVSTATVSRVVNETGLVKPATRARVVRAIADLNYHPNLHARTLAGGKSRTIGMIVSNLENPFFLDVFRAVETLAHASGYEVVVANTDYSTERLVRSIRLMIGRRVAGLAAIVSEMEPALIDELTSSGIPVVFYDVGTARANITNIRVNYRKGIEKAVEYLHSLGHWRIGFVGHDSVLGPIHDRIQCLLDLVPCYTPRLEVRHAVDTDSFEGGQRAVRELLRSGPQPTAIMCVNDFMAVGVIRELRERGLRVPADISVTGFDNIKLADFCYPSLTTVHIPRDVIGKMVFESLVAGTANEIPAGRELIVDPDFLVRESTGRARI